MSILIKGMKMPKNCCDCIFDVRGGCLINLNTEHKNELTHSCPLIELPGHGDLIDRDVLMSHKGSAYDIDGHELYAVGTGTILRMPAVIPAERSEEC